MEPLFYEALRIDRSHDDHYYSRFNCKIPFLNGGLFDPINNYDWVKIDVFLPNELFSNSRKTKEGDTGDGILDVFDRYNFTVCEDEPLEKEVAIDPELLGKVYERFNAINEENFDEYVAALKSNKQGEENKFNKNYGVYYTPREIVHYMCRQSLTEYLVACAEEEKLSPPLNRNDIEDLITLCELITEYESTALKKEQDIKEGKKKSSEYAPLLSDNVRTHAPLIDRWIADLRVCDPAVGSGAFPVGMMTEMVRVRRFLSTYLNDPARTDYAFKRQCIEHSLYGVDIDPGAVEIARLRLWLSLVVDEEDFRNIKPLPNLDYKIVCGNSLIGLPDVAMKDLQLENELEGLKAQLFNETNATKKIELRKKITELFHNLVQSAQQFSSKIYDVNFDFKIHFSEVFHHKDGFDVVIGNPPYIQLQKNHGQLADLYKDKGFETFDRMGDIYCLFYEKGLQILRAGGYLCFITSNKWMRAGYGEKIRSFFLKQNPVILIDLGPGIFESATVDTNILLVQKTQNLHQLKAVTIQRQNNETVDIEAQLNTRGVQLTKLTKDAWFIGSSAEQKLKEKIESIGKPLKDWDVKIYRGILTGLNEAFIITTEKRNEILANCRDNDERKRTEAIIKPILRGRDIKRYYYEWAGLWVIVIPAGWTNENRGKIPPEKFILEQFPSLMDYLKPFEEKAKKRDDQGDYWWELRHCSYYPEFEKEKIIYPNMTKFLPFVYDNEGYYTNQKCFILITKNYLKYLTGYFNSKISYKWIRNNCPELQGGTRELSYIFFQNIPLPPITASNQPIVTQIEELVDKILSAKKSNPQADTSNLEREIDRLVYKLYDLTEEEIRIVENK